MNNKNEMKLMLFTSKFGCLNSVCAGDWWNFSSEDGQSSLDKECLPFFEDLKLQCLLCGISLSPFTCVL